MSWFQLDPESLADRAAGREAPSLGGSLRIGTLGFTIVSVAGFVPWGVFGKWFHGHGGELSMYAVCAVIFIGLSGLLLHRLIMGTGSLARFYKLFTLAFTAYAVAWTAGWMSLRGHPGSVAGLLAGTVAMGWMLAAAFDARTQALKVIAALFVLNSAGYFAGGWMEGYLVALPELTIGNVMLTRSTQVMVAMLQWGVCYGMGLGAGLGLAFYFCQTKARALLASRS